MDIEGHYVRQFLLERVIGDYRIIRWHLAWVNLRHTNGDLQVRFPLGYLF